ncbi:MAG: DUF1254 domain-containing protein [Saprospiraceae bacterium]
MKNLFPLLLFLFLFGCQKTSQDTDGVATPQMTSDEMLQTLGEIYLYGYPLVLTDLTQKRITGVEKPDKDRPLAPINQLGHYRKFPDPTTRTVVKPNVDTYYSISWFDLSSEPQWLTIPATERYYVMQFLDAFSNVIGSVGPRTTGKERQQVLIAGQNWEGTVPDSVTLIRSSTDVAWLLGRIQVNSVEDGATTVRAIQDGMRLRPFSQRNNENYQPPLGKAQPDDRKITPVQMMQDMGTDEYLNYLAELLVKNPPAAADSAMVEKMKAVGLEPGKPFALTSDNLMLKLKMKAIPGVVHQKFNERRSAPPAHRIKDNWLYMTDSIGDYGTDYRFRAYIAYIGFGANLPVDAVYPNTSLDSEGRPLDGKHNYKFHFAADQLPPVNAFWSLTAYNAEEFLIENEMDRYAVGDRSDLEYNADGSLDIYLQHERPAADKLQNWLPIVEEGKFYLTLRLYWPKAEVLNGMWELPKVERLEK